MNEPSEPKEKGVGPSKILQPFVFKKKMFLSDQVNMLII